jgi:hypothetical protein
MKSKERGVMNWLTRMNKCIVGKEYKQGEKKKLGAEHNWLLNV